MSIELRSSNVPFSLTLEEHVTRRLGFAVGRFSHRIDRVVVRLVDLNGPKGGPDKRCRIVAHVDSGQDVVVEATDHDAYVAVSQAAIRLDEAVARVITRRRPRSNRRPTARARRNGVAEAARTEGTS